MEEPHTHVIYYAVLNIKFVYVVYVGMCSCLYIKYKVRMYINKKYIATDIIYIHHTIFAILINYYKLLVNN